MSVTTRAQKRKMADMEEIENQSTIDIANYYPVTPIHNPDQSSDYLTPVGGFATPLHDNHVFQPGIGFVYTPNNTITIAEQQHHISPQNRSAENNQNVPPPGHIDDFLLEEIEDVMGNFFAIFDIGEIANIMGDLNAELVYAE
jgi:hypothetical protein